MFFFPTFLLNHFYGKLIAQKRFDLFSSIAHVETFNTRRLEWFPLCYLTRILALLPKSLHTIWYNFNQTYHQFWNPFESASVITSATVHMSMKSMVIRVVEFWRRVVENWKDLCLKEIYWFLRIGVMGRCQKVTKFDFQSQLSMSKIIWIFLNFFFIEEYQFWSTSFVIDIFW